MQKQFSKEENIVSYKENLKELITSPPPPPSIALTYSASDSFSENTDREFAAETHYNGIKMYSLPFDDVK